MTGSIVKCQCPGCHNYLCEGVNKKIYCTSRCQLIAHNKSDESKKRASEKVINIGLKRGYLFGDDKRVRDNVIAETKALARISQNWKDPFRCVVKSPFVSKVSFCIKCSCSIQTKTLSKKVCDDCKKISMKLTMFLFRQKNRTGLDYKIAKVMQRSIRDGYSSSLYDILGYTDVQFKYHLELQFDKRMSWTNYGTYWEIDHIIPISTANTDADIIRLNQLSNLRPLSRTENAIKSNKIINLI
jgi:hypothetical protein